MPSPLPPLEPAPLQLWEGSVLPDWLDYNGHMTEHRYLQVFGESSDALYQRIGVNLAQASKGAYFTLETHITHLAEAREGDVLFSDTEILAHDEKRLHLWHRILNNSGAVLATGEHLSIHVREGKSCTAPGEMLGRIRQIFEAQKALPLPDGSGKVLRRALEYRRPQTGIFPASSKQ